MRVAQRAKPDGRGDRGLFPVTFASGTRGGPGRLETESRVTQESFVPDGVFVHARRLTESAGIEDGGKEACGVFGVYAPGEDVARLTFYGLYALQHRGQESAGIATADGTDLLVRTGMGLGAQVFVDADHG